MRIPRQFWIGEDHWRVKFVKEIAPLDGKGRRTLGLCDGDDHIIYIVTGLKKVERTATFIHELIHALDFSHKLNIPHSIVYDLDKHVTEFLFDNWLRSA